MILLHEEVVRGTNRQKLLRKRVGKQCRKWMWSTNMMVASADPLKSLWCFQKYHSFYQMLESFRDSIRALYTVEKVLRYVLNSQAMKIIGNPRQGSERTEAWVLVVRRNACTWSRKKKRWNVCARNFGQYFMNLFWPIYFQTVYNSYNIIFFSFKTCGLKSPLDNTGLQHFSAMTLTVPSTPTLFVQEGFITVNTLQYLWNNRALLTSFI